MSGPTHPTLPPSVGALHRDVADAVDRLRRDLGRLAAQPEDPDALLRMSEVLSYQTDVLVGRLNLAERDLDGGGLTTPGIRRGLAMARREMAELADLGRRMAACADRSRFN